MTAGRDLVLGGAGFIGPNLARQLLAEGRRVTVLDDLSVGSQDRLAGLDPARVEFVAGSILDSPLLDRLLAGVERVFNLACIGMRHSIGDPVAAHAVNATGVLTLMEAARSSRLSRIVHVSSSEVYGPAIRSPIDETHPTAPTSTYGASKLAGEAYARSYQRSHGLPVVIVRPFNAYGPGCYVEGDNVEVIPRFMRMAIAGQPLAVMGDGAQSRAFTYVDDTARGMLLAGSAPNVVGETINLGNPHDVAIGVLAQKISLLIRGGESEIVHDDARAGEVRRVVADSSKAAALLGWRPSVEIDEGLSKLYAWLQHRAETVRAVA